MKEQDNICIYRHIRLDNNTVFYIGIGYEKRSKDKLNRNKYWNNIVNKTDYEIEILKRNMSWQDACELETMLIDYYGRKDLKNGLLCNLTNGGEGSFGRKVSKETLQKMSNALKGKLGTWNGKKHSEESKIKMSNYRKGKATFFKKVIDCDTRKIYSSCKEAADFFGITSSTLSYHLNKENSNLNVKYYE